MGKKKIFVVTCDGHFCEGYGSEIYLIGVFSSEEDAHKAIEAQPDNMRLACKTIGVNLGDVYLMTMSNYYLRCTGEELYGNELYLGGYSE